MDNLFRPRTVRKPETLHNGKKRPDGEEGGPFFHLLSNDLTASLCYNAVHLAQDVRLLTRRGPFSQCG